MNMRIRLLVGLTLFFVQSAAVSQETPLDELRTIKSLAQKSLPEGSKILVTCGMSEGRGYYVSPIIEAAADDKITDGRLVIFIDQDSEPNILFRDSRGAFVNAKEDGAVMLFSFVNEQKNAFGLIETYPETGVTQTYVFSKGVDSKMYLLWTSAKAHMSIANITKVSSHRSICI